MQQSHLLTLVCVRRQTWKCAVFKKNVIRVSSSPQSVFVGLHGSSEPFKLEHWRDAKWNLTCKVLRILTEGLLSLITSAEGVKNPIVILSSHIISMMMRWLNILLNNVTHNCNYWWFHQPIKAHESVELEAGFRAYLWMVLSPRGMTSRAPSLLTVLLAMSDCEISAEASPWPAWEQQMSSPQLWNRINLVFSQELKCHTNQRRSQALWCASAE